MLDDVFAAVRATDTRFVVYGTERTPALERQLASYNVRVAHRRTDADVSPFVVVEADGAFVGALPPGKLASLLDPPLVRPDAPDGDDDTYEILFEALDETVYAALSRRELLVVSREIEDRAFRVGAGSLRVGFQRLSAFREQTDVYRRLAGDTDLDVHVYGAADCDPPDIPGLTVHRGTDELTRYWFLAFGGVGTATTCALVARETEDGYDGFWTDDPALTREIMDTVAAV